VLAQIDNDAVASFTPGDRVSLVPRPNPALAVSADLASPSSRIRVRKPRSDAPGAPSFRPEPRTAVGLPYGCYLMLPVCPRENEPGCGHTSRPCGPESTGSA